MADVRETRQRVFLVLIALIVLDLFCAAVLLSPMTRSRGARHDELKKLQTELNIKTRDAVPLRGIDEKVGAASKQITGFYQERLPATYSAITENLGQRATADNVKVDNVRYDGEDSDVPGLERVRITASVQGDYLQMVKFINALERDRMFFIIDSVNLGEQQGGKVRLDLQLETYRKTGA